MKSPSSWPIQRYLPAATSWRWTCSPTQLRLKSRAAIQNGLDAVFAAKYRHAADLFQRAGMLKQTDADMARYLTGYLDKPTVQAGAAVALGTTARLLARQGEEEVALQARQALKAGLKKAKRPTVKRGFIAGLGNSHATDVATVPYLEFAGCGTQPSVVRQRGHCESSTL